MYQQDEIQYNTLSNRLNEAEDNYNSSKLLAIEKLRKPYKENALLIALSWGLAIFLSVAIDGTGRSASLNDTILQDIALVWSLLGFYFTLHFWMEVDRKAEKKFDPKIHTANQFKELQKAKQDLFTFEQNRKIYSRSYPEHWLALKGIELEEEIKASFNLTLNASFELTKAVGDDGIDIIGYDSDGLPKYLIQAKGWSKPVGSPEIRNFIGSVQQFPSAKNRLFIAPNGFSNPAIRYAGQHNIQLIDAQGLANNAKTILNKN